MVGGIVVGVNREIPDRGALVLVREKNNECFVRAIEIVDGTDVPVTIHHGDNLWWQGGRCYWTPPGSANSERYGMDSDIPLSKLGYSYSEKPYRKKEKLGPIGRYLLWVKARFRLSMKAVCLASEGRGAHGDFHDYPDSTLGVPAHFIELICKRCGKTFFC